MTKRARIRAVALLALVALLMTGPHVAGQTKRPVAPTEFDRWESLVTHARGLSPDGRWLAYGITRSSRESELRLTNVADGSTKTFAFGGQPAFSADSRHVAFAIGHSEAEEARLRRQRKPIHRKLGLLRLDTGEATTIDGIESFAFSPTGGHIAMKRYAPEPPDDKPAEDDRATDASPAPADDPDPRGATLVVRELASGRDMTFGNVSEFAWRDKPRRGTADPAAADLLALAITTSDRTGNGIQLYAPAGGALRVLDSAPAIYSGLAWRKDADDLVALRAVTSDRHDGPTHAVLAWKGLASGTPAAHLLDPEKAEGLPPGMRTVSYRRPSWSEDGRRVFVGTARWGERPPEEPKPEKGDREGPDDEVASVEVWHARDIDVLPRQKINARADRQRSLLAVWHLADGRLVRLGSSAHERVVPLPYQPRAYALNWESHAMDRTIGRGRADVWLIDLQTGLREKAADALVEHYVQASPGGRYLLYVEADQYWTVDTATGQRRNISRDLASSFIDREADVTVAQKPPFGVAGWTRNDAAVILYDEFDLWRLPTDGTAAERLTHGAAEQIRHRYSRLDADEEWIDFARPVHLSLFGIRTKRSGFARLEAGGSRVHRELFLDRGVDRLTRASDAEVYAYVVQAFDAPPVIRVGGAKLADAKVAVETNPFFAEHAWGAARLVEYTSERGERLQGALFLPAGYEPGRRYPMVVYMYERLSDNLHRWSSPSAREPYNPAVFTSLGYAFFMPDIVFRPREPGLSVVECVGPAVKKVTDMGIADPARIGIVGHSWGGFDTVYLATHTTLFAAGVAGAPITNLVSNYGNHHWTSGIAETDHIETGQQRMEVPLWEDLPAYIRNSAVFNVHKMTTPLLVAFGDQDGTVHWHQGVELYNIARRAGKQVVMLVYNREDHGLRRKPNQLDYQRRVLQWFGHYLKGEPAAGWITEGVSHLGREQELKRAKAKKTS